MNEKIKRIKGIAIVVLLILISYVGVFTAGHYTGAKAGHAIATEQSEEIEDRIQQTSDYSDEVIEGITGVEEGLKDSVIQVDASRQKVIISREEVEHISGIVDRITERSESIKGYSDELTKGSGSIDSGFSDIEEILDEILRQN